MTESETIEYKKSLAELSEGLNSMAAILNKHGSGELWFGIRNDGRPVGMDVSETTLRKVSQAIAAHIEPKIYPEVSHVSLDGKSCIRVSFSGNEKPYYAHGRAYMRVADEDRQLSAKEIESIILRKNRSHRGWDLEPLKEGSFKPDTAKIRAYVRKAGLPWTNTKDTLENLGLYVNVPEIDRDAFREAIINAFCHRDYRDPDEVRIAVFPDRVEVRNPGTLMEGVTLRSLRTAKVSRRRNPLIADLLRRIQYIEAWGRGIPLILEKAPNVRFSQVTPQVEALLEVMETEHSREELQSLLKLSDRHNFKKLYLLPALESALIERTIPEKPNSRLQKYRLTVKGRAHVF